jgi:hypothetical protein
VASQEEKWQQEQEVVDYTYQGYEYWGHIPGTIRGLPSSAMVGNLLTFQVGVGG